MASPVQVIILCLIMVPENGRNGSTAERLMQSVLHFLRKDRKKSLVKLIDRTSEAKFYQWRNLICCSPLRVLLTITCPSLSFSYFWKSYLTSFLQMFYSRQRIVYIVDCTSRLTLMCENLIKTYDLYKRSLC